MPAATDHLEFSPPPQPGMLRALALAVLAHLLLVAALTWGLRWDRDAPQAAVQAEIWSSLPREAAPREVAPPPPPPPTPAVRPTPAPAPQEADIALEREKRRQAELQRRAQEQQAQLERERRHKAEEQKQQEARRLEEQKRQQAAAQRAADQRRKDEQEREERKRQQEREAQEASRLAQLRAENLRRIQGLAGASGSEQDRGNAAQSAGPSAGWAARVRARVKPNIVFSDDVAGNPTAEVEVRLAPDGTIVSRRIRKSSGLRAWDEAVLRALDKTEVLPRDTDGRAPSDVLLVFRPKD